MLKKLFFAGVLIAVILLAITQLNRRENTISKTTMDKISQISVASPAFTQGGEIPKKYSCDGEGINPPLSIDDVPAQAKSLVLIVDDPDAPRGIFTHWLLFNINPETRAINENSVPGEAGINDAGKYEFVGLCPPAGQHRYFFKIFALDANLNLPKGVDRRQLEKAMSTHVVAEGEFMGTYSRN